MKSLLNVLSHETNKDINAILEDFGTHLFSVFVNAFPQFVDASKSLFEFVLGVDSYIHVEVFKLYPTAELPVITYPEYDDQKMVLIYKSKRKISHLAKGLLKGAAVFFKEAVHIQLIPLVQDESEVKIILEKNNE